MALTLASVTYLARRSRCVVVPVVAAAIAAACDVPTPTLKPSPITPSELLQCPPGPDVPHPQTLWPCPPASAIREIDADVKLEFLEDPTAGTFVCHAAEGSADLTWLQKGAYQKLWLLKRLQFDTPLPWTTKSLWEWFIGNVHKIQYLRTNYARCCGSGGVMWLPATSAVFGFPDPSGLVHEARHGDRKPHTCGTKDQTISEMGAFGVVYYFDLWLADHVLSPDLTVEERNYARWLSEVLRVGAFCVDCGGL
jgi:hypothetical protein